MIENQHRRNARWLLCPTGYALRGGNLGSLRSALRRSVSEVRWSIGLVYITPNNAAFGFFYTEVNDFIAGTDFIRSSRND